MGFAWNDDLRTGIRDIDDQHKELISRINGLLDACSQSTDRVEIGRYLTFLREYVAFHFAAEEREMTGHRYPGLPAHEAEHEHFKKEVNKLHQQFFEHGWSIQVLLTTIRSSGEWLLNHIQKTDREMAAFLKRRASG
jgi:hemerythrin